MKIKGNTVGFPNPQPDWNQTDETQADYILNKPPVYVDGDGYTQIEGQPRVTAVSVLDATEAEVSSIVMAVELNNGGSSTYIVHLDENKRPSQIIVDGVAVAVAWR